MLTAANGPTARFAFERAVRIDQELRNKKHVSKRDLAEMLEVAPRTIQRDLEFIRDRLTRPLAYNAARRAYYYNEPVAPLGDVHISDGNLRALIVAKVAHMPTASSGEALLSAVAASLPQRQAKRLAQLQGAFYFKPFGEAKIKTEIFESLVSAVIDGTEIRFSYDKLGRNEPETRVARPFTLCCIDNMW